MKVLQINSVYAKGSTGRIVADIEAMLEQKGIETFVAYGYGLNPISKKHYRIENKLQQKISILQTRLFGKHCFYNKSETKKLLNWIGQIKPDIIHLHNIHGHYINIQLLFGYIKKNNIPVVWTLHDCWSFTGHCAHFEQFQCKKWKTGCNKCKFKSEYPISWFFDRSKESWLDKKELFTKIDNIVFVTPSNWLKNLAMQSFIKEKEILTIYNGVDLNVFRPKENSLREKLNLQNCFVILGMHYKWSEPENKDTVKYILEHTSQDTRVIIIGGHQLDNGIKSDKLILVDHITNPNELADYYSMADVFVNLTLKDNFPTVNIEALACGTPVITYDTGGSPECIEAQEGEVVNRFDGLAICKAINNIRKHKFDYEAKARRRAERMYNQKENYEQYLEIYRMFQ